MKLGLSLNRLSDNEIKPLAMLRKLKSLGG